MITAFRRLAEWLRRRRRAREAGDPGANFSSSQSGFLPTNYLGQDDARPKH